jgi:hypothetical protein
MTKKDLHIIYYLILTSILIYISFEFIRMGKTFIATMIYMGSVFAFDYMATLIYRNHE